MIGILLLIMVMLAICAFEYHVMKEFRIMMGVGIVLIGLVLWQHLTFTNSHLHKTKEVNREGSRNIIG